jgi:phosphate transport system substrate-binding protein
MRRNLFTLLVALVMLALAACGRQQAAPAATATPVAATAAGTGGMVMGDGIWPEVNPLEVSGDIIVAGSSTVFPLTEAMVERFIDEGYGGNITIDSIGTGAGFERFCVSAESDIANASRPIKSSEVESCRGNNRDPIEFRVGTDALAIVVNPANDWIDDVTVEQLALLFSNEVTNWNEVDESWPDAPILRFTPGTDSGTFDYFIEAVMDVAYEGAGAEALLDAANLQLSEDDNVLVQGVEGDINALGYFGYAYYEENAGRLKILNVNGVEPSAQQVEDGTYPLARPLFVYSSANIMQEKPQVAAFINFYLSFVQEEVERVGYFAASEAIMENARNAWLQANQ